MHRGPDAIIVLIFFFSGLILNARQIRSGLMDIKGIAIALAIILQVSLFPQCGTGPCGLCAASYDTPFKWMDIWWGGLKAVNRCWLMVIY
jgi:predicted Na+-dependent transporter